MNTPLSSVASTYGKTALCFIAMSRDQQVFFQRAETILRATYTTSCINLRRDTLSLSLLIQALYKPSAVTQRAQLEQSVMLYLRRKKHTAKGLKKGALYWYCRKHMQQYIARYKWLLYARVLDRHLGEAEGEAPTSLSQVLGIWNGVKFNQSILIAVAKERNLPILYFETGPLPQCIQISPTGINADLDIGYYFSDLLQKKGTPSPPILPPLAQCTSPTYTEHMRKRRIFVPFQVVEDSNIYAHSPYIATMWALYAWLEVLVETFPLLEIRIKEHPQCTEKYASLQHKHARIQFLAPDTPIHTAIAASDMVITINSTVGLEAISDNKPVITLGKALYNLEGYVLHARTPEELVHAVAAIEAGWLPDPAVKKAFAACMQQRFFYGEDIAPVLLREVPDALARLEVLRVE